MPQSGHAAACAPARIAWLAYASVFIVSVAGVDSVAAQTAQGPLHLQPGRRFVRALAPGGQHDFILDLRAGRATVVTVRQRGVDVVLTVMGPDGRERHRVDRPNVEWGREAITVVADATGSYQLKVSTLVPIGPAGRYRLDMAAARRTTDRDRQRVDAERAVSAGKLARGANTLEGCREAVERFRRAAYLWSAA